MMKIIRNLVYRFCMFALSSVNRGRTVRITISSPEDSVLEQARWLLKNDPVLFASPQEKQ